MPVPVGILLHKCRLIDRLNTRTDFARLVTVVGCETPARVMHWRQRVPNPPHLSKCSTLQAQPSRFCLHHHPLERHISQSIIRIPTSNVRMHACEPNLLQPSSLDLSVF